MFVNFIKNKQLEQLSLTNEPNYYLICDLKSLCSFYKKHQDMILKIDPYQDALTRLGLLFKR